MAVPVGEPLVIDLGQRAAVLLVVLPPDARPPFDVAGIDNLVKARWDVENADAGEGVSLVITWVVDMSRTPRHTMRLMWNLDNPADRASLSDLAGLGARGYVISVIAYPSAEDRLNGREAWLGGDLRAATERAIAVACVDGALLGRFDGLG